MYVAVKGGEKAISAAHKRLAEKRRGNLDEKSLTIKQIRQQLPYAVDRVMIEGSLYDPQLAALSIKQAAGDLIEAIFLLRAFRTTLERFCDSQPLDTGRMRIERRISAAFKDVPGGQVLGPTFDYTVTMSLGKQNLEPLILKYYNQKTKKMCRILPTF
jgi:alpha-D-ribose 1-methylphosphonate 5-triphosphate synthase subunit PhnI